jgi:hypothetical protein
MAMHNAPIWAERDRPSLRLEDVRGDGRSLQYAALVSGGGVYDGHFVDYVNDYKVPLQEELRAAQDDTDAYMFGHGIDLRRLTRDASVVVGEPAYPQYRIVMTDAITKLPTYQRLQRGLFFDQDVHTGNPVQIGCDFSPVMHVVRVCSECTHRAEEVDVIDAVARGVGQALLSPCTDIWMSGVAALRNTPEAVSSGYSYRYNNQQYGAFMQHAATAKIAAGTRYLMGVPADNPPDTHPLLEPYTPRSWNMVSTLAALAVDVVAQQLDPEEGQRLWRDFYGMARSDQLDARRADVAARISEATGGRLLLEDFDKMPVTTPTEGLRSLEYTEEACGVDDLVRPSTAIKHASI